MGREASHTPQDEPPSQGLSTGGSSPGEPPGPPVAPGQDFSSEPIYHDGQSIHDEPDIFPGRVGEVVECDWSCSACGYNLRGLPLERGCPECGHRELYRPPPVDANSYKTWLMARQDVVRERAAWVTVGVVVLVGGIFAVITALLKTAPGMAIAFNMPILAIVFAPVVEETMKVAVAAYLVEIRPYRFTRVEQIQVSTLGAAFVFAAIENLLYLHVYASNPSGLLIVWRWTVCVAVHVGCTLVATRGLVAVWQRAVTEYRRPRLGGMFPSLVAAILLHGMYNAGMLGWTMLRGPM